MMHRLALALAAAATGFAAVAFAAPAPMPSLLRVGYQSAKPSPCAAPGPSTPAPLAALAGHLARRLALRVELCGFDSPAAAASALARGSVDLTALDQAAWPAARGKGRPILTLRPDGALPRTPIIAVTLNDAGPLTAPAIAQRRVITLKQNALAYDAARAAVATHGGTAIANRPTPAVGSVAATFAMLSSRQADVALMPIDEWYVACAAKKPVCQPYRIAWRDRPLAKSAWVLRTGLPDELRFRLIGIFLVLHQENAPAFAGASGGAKGAFEPTEASALDPAGAAR